ncbi:hypothetical protein Tco_1457741, partial [Tanacetum coccineum]
MAAAIKPTHHMVVFVQPTHPFGVAVNVKPTHPGYGGDEVSAAAAATVEGEGDVGGCRRRRWGPTAATGEGHDGGLKIGRWGGFLVLTGKARRKTFPAAVVVVGKSPEIMEKRGRERREMGESVVC